jgi:hypothetical protein
VARLAAPIVVALLALGAATAASAAERGFELVSPADKGGTDVGSGSEILPFLSESGDVSSYVVLNALPGGDPTGNGVLNEYRSIRGPEGWSAHQINSLLDAENTLNSSTYNVFSSDLMAGVQAGPLSPPATPDAADGTLNLYLNDASGFHLITVGAEPFDPEFFAEPLGGSDDLSRVVFAVFGGQRLNEESPPGVLQLLYEWDTATETPKIVGRLPGGTASPDSVVLATPPVVGGQESVSFNPISSDGSRIFFYTPDSGEAREIYVRIAGTETKQVSESQRTVPDPINGEPIFRFASDDGSVVYFTSSEKLTDDATTGPTDEGEDLYRYVVDSGELTDISVDAGDPNGAEVQGVLGTSSDGSRAYFAAKGVLATGAVAGQNNLYLWTDDGSAAGEVTFVAPDASAVNWQPDNSSPVGGHQTGRVTPDGSHLLFESTASLTGYANEGHLEAYLFDAEADTEQLVCASCNPAGTPATADAISAGAGQAVHVARTLSNDGRRVFFTTAERLLPGDTNSAKDAYEYDAETEQVNLISTGKGQAATFFADASVSGDDVLLLTRQRLVGIDRDDNYDVYDARVGGGIAAQNPPPPPAPCAGEACRAPVVAPPPATVPNSSQVSGPGNVKPRHRHHRRKHKHHKHSNHSRRGTR